VFVQNFLLYLFKYTIIMKVEYKYNQIPTGKIQKLVEFLENSPYLWKYMGMVVELDPTVDFNSQNVLIRWIDIEEGFNDKIIVNSLIEFKKLFGKNND